MTANTGESAPAIDFLRPPEADVAPLFDPNRAVPLSLEKLNEVPQSPGLYAIWILDASTLRACGIDGPAPKLLYVGKAQPQLGGLRRRLHRHVGDEWGDLSELLAVRGHVLFPWWVKQFPIVRQSTIRPTTPLAELCQGQTIDWQNKFLRYTWLELDLLGRQLTDLEATVIRYRQPMLNRQLLPRFPPPQLRASSRYQRARARWLWHTSWAGVLLNLPDDSYDEWCGPEDVEQSDELGYPSPVAEAARSLSADIGVDWIPLEEMNELMVHCAQDAPESVRAAVAATTDVQELELWWAAHAAAPFLNCSLEDALTASLNGATEHDYPGPPALPLRERIQRLLQVGDQTFQRGTH